MKATITSIAHWVPPDVYNNQWFEERLDTSDEWIKTRTGITERHFLGEGGVTDILAPAALKALERR